MKMCSVLFFRKVPLLQSQTTQTIDKNASVLFMVSNGVLLFDA